MKESKFIELLNLYVDQELSPTEAAQLEAEIAANPARRRTYEQYCRMQRGCSLLFEQIRANAPDHAELASAGRAVERKVLDFPTERLTPRRSAWTAVSAVVAWGGGLAAAAAVVTVVLLREPAPSADAVASNMSAPAAAIAEVSPAPVEAAPSPRRPAHYQLAAQIHRTDEKKPQSASSDENVDLKWINQLELSAVPRLSPEDLKFSNDRSSPSRGTSLLHTHSAPYTPGEAFNAFEFRR